MSLPAANPDKQPDNKTTADLGLVLPLTAQVQDSHLLVGGVDMVDLAHREGTPLYVYDEADMRSRMKSYVSAFRGCYGASDVIYASKAFLNKEMARIVADEGLCLDVSGGGELACALAAGFPAEHVFEHGNNKTPVEIEEAVSAGVGRIVVDNLTELARVSEIAGRFGVVQDIYLRIAPGVEAETHEYIRTGCEDTKFGFTMRDGFALSCVGDVLETPHVRLAGLHCHIGSQIFALVSFRETIHIMAELMARIRDEYDYTIEELDLGGGLGVAYVADDAPATIDEFAKMCAAAVEESCTAHDLPLPRLLVEPGRSLVANAGLTLYTVGSVKTLPGIRTYVALDGGMSDNIRTALYHAEYEAVLANKAADPRTRVVTLAGKHCESGDVVAVDVSIQEPEVGDIVCVFGTGAYCSSMASNYNGQPRPAVVFVCDGISRVVTRRETYDDLIQRDV